MSRKKRRLQPPSFGGKLLLGPSIKSFTVGSWCPTPDGSGPPQAVAMSIADLRRLAAEMQERQEAATAAPWQDGRIDDSSFCALDVIGKFDADGNLEKAVCCNGCNFPDCPTPSREDEELIKLARNTTLPAVALGVADECERLRTTNRELNRRCQKAESELITDRRRRDGMSKELAGAIHSLVVTHRRLKALSDEPYVQASEAMTRAMRAEHKAEKLVAECERLRLRLLTAAGDDLCRLSQDEIKAMTAGAVQIPPKDEFLASCERFHAQVAKEAGVLEGCLTMAQLVAENEKLRAELAERDRIIWGYENESDELDEPPGATEAGERSGSEGDSR